jgi:hypothetical protein
MPNPNGSSAQALAKTKVARSNDGKRSPFETTLARCVPALFLGFAVEKVRSFGSRDVSEMSVRDATAGARVALHVAQHRTSPVAQPRVLAALAALALAVPVAACHGDDTGSADAGQEADAPAPACAGASVCDGTAVRACRAGHVAEVLEDCGPDGACSLGRCTSPECAQAELDFATVVGCTFYTLELENVTSDDAIPSSVLVTNPGQVAAMVALERRADMTWSSTSSVSVPPMRTARVQLDDTHFEGGGLAPHAALRLTSDRPVIVVHVQSDDSAPGGSRSSGGTMILPAHVLGARYRALTYGQVATPRLLDTPGARGGAGEIVVIGTADNTALTISPSSMAGPVGGAPPAGPDGKLRLVLDDGDVFTLFSAADGADLTGTEIAADQPVAVFSGNIATTYGIAAMGISSPDMAEEQLLPAGAWGTSYVAARLPPQAGVCDPFLPSVGPSPASGASIWTIVADADATHVRFRAPSGPPPAPDRTIMAGESFHIFAPDDFTVTASGPIQVMQGMDCEPSLSSAVPTSRLLSDHWFGVLPNFDTMMAIVRPAGQPVFLDGARIEDSLFQPVGAGFDVARLPVDPCAPSDVVCTHHLEGKFGFTMRGMDVLASYALTVPTWPCSDPTGTNCIN